MASIRPKDLPSITEALSSDRLLLDGSTARSISVEDFLENNVRPVFIDVRSFGAVGDGVDDDTDALQDALDFAATSKKLVWLPAGTYLTSSQLSIPAGVSIAGAGWSSVIWGNHAGRTLSYEDINTSGMFLRDIQIRGNLTSSTGFGNGTSTAIYFATTAEQSAHFSAQNVKIYGHGKGWDASDTYGMFDSTLDKVDFFYCSVWGLHWTGSGNKMRGITTRVCAIGTSVGAVSGVSIAGGEYDGTCIANGVDFDFTAANVRKMTINVWCEQTATTSFRNSSGGTLNFVDFVLYQPLFQPAATATGTGTVDIGTITGNFVVESPVVYTSQYGSATISSPTISGATSKFTMASAVLINGSGVRTQLANIGPVDGPASSADNVVVRMDGTSGTKIQGSPVVVDDSGNLTTTGFLATLAGGGAGTAILGRIGAHGSGATVTTVSARGTDSASNSEVYGEISQVAVDNTSTSEDGRWDFRTVIAGTLATRFSIGHGLFAAGQSDMGAGTINGALYQNGLSIGRVLLASGTVTNAAQLDIVMTSFPANRGIEIELIDFLPVTDAVNLLARFSTDGGSTFDSAAASYSWMTNSLSDAGSGAVGNSSGDTSITIAASGGGIGNAATKGYTGAVKFTGASTATTWNRIGFSGSYIDSFGAFITIAGNGARRAAQDTDAIRFLFSSGNIASGKYAVYGLL